VLRRNGPIARTVRLALFPSYAFINLQGSGWINVCHSPGVRTLLRNGNQPAWCPDGTVEALQASEHTRATPLPSHRSWRPGDPCQLTTGPFAHMPAVIHALDDHSVTITLLMFGELRNVSVNNHDLSPINE